MKNISEDVRAIVTTSEVAFTALREGYLNLSAYAETIQREVELRAKKPVSKGSIVVALSRLAREMKKSRGGEGELVLDVILENIVVKAGLVEITFERTLQNNRLMQRIYADETLNTEDFFMISQGIGEITLITSQENKNRIEKLFKKSKPKVTLHGLVAISITFSKKQLHLPNIIFSLVRSLALKQINIIEIVSTRSELAFILTQKELQTAFSILNDIYQRGINKVGS